MKLIDILVQELPKRGGWPDGIEEIWQDYDGLIRPGAFGWNHDQIAEDHRRKHEDAHVKINRKQYEAALMDSKPEWDGEGLPPVGCLLELMDDSQSSLWGNARIKFWGDSFAVWDDYGEECSNSLCHVKVRPIRSEADKKRDEAIESIKAMLMYDYGDDPRLNDAVILYDAIASGKIPHICIY